jgi:hypothetical protein
MAPMNIYERRFVVVDTNNRFNFADTFGVAEPASLTPFIIDDE